MKIIYEFLVVLLFSLLFILSIVTNLFSGNNVLQWQIGEELTYKVKWSFIRLGTLKLHVVDTLTIDDKLVYHVKLFIDSNPLLFFVNIHSVYETYFDTDLHSKLFLADEKIDNITYKTKYQFNYQDSLIHINMTDMNDPNKTIIRNDPLNETIWDGITMIFYARSNITSTKTDTIIAFFEGRRGKVVINFRQKKDIIKIGAIQSPMESYYLDGEIKMKAIVGLTGPFKGWFAVDSQHPPLKAQLKVFIGYVNVELEEWKNWKPKIKGKQNHGIK